MSLHEYQQTLRVLLEEKLTSQTACEWRTRIGTSTYSPRLDVAVGPFSIEDGVHLTGDYNELFHRNIAFFSKLVKCHLANIHIITRETESDAIEFLVDHKLQELNRFNYNSRCFIGIEIENAVSRKHLMGGAINASVLGRIGIAVGYTDEMHNAFLNLYRYFAFLQSVDKPTFKTNNLLIISAEQLMDICTDPEA